MNENQSSIEMFNELIANADAAFANSRYETALGWYQKALAVSGDDLYAVSRAGTLCVALKRYEESLLYFKHALELDSENGDNYFNYANACFFANDFTQALRYYTEAERIGCSDDAMNRLYFQLALIFNIKQDFETALIYIAKCEELDKSGKLANNADFISAKLQLYMGQQDFENAVKTAAQLVAVQPKVFKNYMIYFSLLMVRKDFMNAEKALRDAKKYAAESADDILAFIQEYAALCEAIGDNDEAMKEGALANAGRMIQKQLDTDQWSLDQRAELVITLAKVCQKQQKHNDALKWLAYVKAGMPFNEKPVVYTGEETVSDIDDGKEAFRRNYPEYVDNEDIVNARDWAASNGVGPDSYNDPIVYERIAHPDEQPEAETLAPFLISTERRELVTSLMLTSYLELDQFAEALAPATELSQSETRYYAYYGRYTHALANSKVNGETTEVMQEYAESLAYFRMRMLENHTDVLAAVFRARMYAETHQLDKAKEIAGLLAEEDSKPVFAYIATFES